ncbi:unnamed protein product [Vicia faba]|uniref:Uncharacterized protein n=1 Tax=Vicia faba TaxID=3906 RepID=A0AAV0ZA30_VICFA|nr:unnamed protein product [Vicia faba]
MRNARDHHNLLYIICFLTDLDANFFVVKSQILLMEPLPPMNKIFSMVLQHERKGKLAPSDDSQALINVAGFKRSGSKLGNSNVQYNTSKSKICTHYGKTGHTIEVTIGNMVFPLIMVKDPWPTMLLQMKMMMITMSPLNHKLIRIARLQSLKNNLTNW